MPDLGSAVLFQHNVEAVIWKRQAERARNPAVRAYFGLQARKMRDYEREVCRKVKSIIAVSEADAAIMRNEYGRRGWRRCRPGSIWSISLRSRAEPAADLVFVGSMDWMPNIDGVTWFVQEILPLIRKRRPETTLAVVGRKPGREILELARRDPRIQSHRDGSGCAALHVGIGCLDRAAARWRRNAPEDL